MAASRKHDKSSKTAHVLNLITSPAQKQAAQESPEPAETIPAVPPEASTETSAAAPAAAPAALAAAPAIPAILSPHTLTQPVMPDAHSEQALSDQIRQALEVELTKPDPEPTPPPKPAPKKPAPAPVMQAQPEPIPAMPSQPAPAPVMQAQPEPQPAEASAPSEDDLMYVNIMQKMVEDKASRYIKMLGLCTCPQCTMDVKALALSNLVPKYAVTPKQIPIPMLTIYEQRYGSIVSTQLMNACKTVMKKPRHHV